MKKIISLVCFALAIHLQLSADEVMQKEASQKYVQKYAGFSITLPEGW